MIQGTTQLLGVFGFPVEHSLSPAIHNKAIEILKLDYIYVPMKVAPEALEAACLGLRALRFTGVNVTLPHKEAVIQYLDSVSDEARAVRAVNTIKNTNGRLEGYTTDAAGYIASLDEQGIALNGKHVLVLGGGGAARSLVMGLALRQLPASITILARTVAKARKIADDAAQCAATRVQAGELAVPTLTPAIGSSDLLINCTSVGMHPNTGQTPVPAELLRPGLVVSDIVYNPLETRLLREAKHAGCVTVDGLGMLIHQGIAAFEIWTGMRPPVQPLRDMAMSQLRSTNHELQTAEKKE
jgi:shikimate dehydrogenase